MFYMCFEHECNLPVGAIKGGKVGDVIGDEVGDAFRK